jgi:hypothetical protein
VRFALLVAPAANRVYARQASALARAELCAVSERALASALVDVREEVFGSVGYITFGLAEGAELTELAHGWLSNLSGTFALFGLEPDGRLAPLPLARWDQLDSDLLTIQKYAGKTNELFTKLLLNVTLAASSFAHERRALALLDPLCGRGTTLNQALMYGFHATGVERDRKDYEAYSLFIQRWVKDKRLKHTVVAGHVKGQPKLDLALGVDKARFKAGESLRLSYVNADTHAVGEVFQPRSFDLIVTDAPYGVQHGAHSAEALARKPLELLTTAIPVWRQALRSGGALGIAWNTHVLARDKLGELLAAQALEVCDSACYRSFQHRVDSAIERDLIVARAP